MNDTRETCRTDCTPEPGTESGGGETPESLARLDAALKRSIGDAEAGRVRPAGDVFVDLAARYANVS